MTVAGAHCSCGGSVADRAAARGSRACIGLAPSPTAWPSFGRRASSACACRRSSRSRGAPPESTRFEISRCGSRRRARCCRRLASRTEPTSCLPRAAPGWWRTAGSSCVRPAGRFRYELHAGAGALAAAEAFAYGGDAVLSVDASGIPELGAMLAFLRRRSGAGRSGRARRPRGRGRWVRRDGGGAELALAPQPAVRDREGTRSAVSGHGGSGQQSDTRVRRPPIRVRLRSRCGASSRIERAHDTRIRQRGR